MRHSLISCRLKSASGTQCRRAAHRTFLDFWTRRPTQCCAAVTSLSPLERQQREQARALERVVDGMDIDSLAALGFHGTDDIRGLVALEAVRSAGLVTVPLSSTLAVSLDEDGGQLSVLAPPEMPPNVKKAIQVVAGLIRETPDHQLLVLAVLLLWARKYGSTAWQEYCEALLPPFRELSCLLCYTPGELSTLQLPHLVEEASRQHDWARWAHSQWLSSSSGALRRLGLADSLEDTLWALAVVRSRAVEFQVGATAGSGSGSGSGSTAGSSRDPARRAPGPVVSVLAPVVDLANHSNDPNCVIQLTTDRSRVVLLPRQPVAAGEPLTVDYGFDRSSLELMADYGFVTSANPYDGEVALPGADKLPPLELPRLQSAARSLLRRRQRLQRHEGPLGHGPGLAAGAVEGEEAEGEGKETLLAVAGGASESAGAGDEEEECFRDRLKAAVELLAPRTFAGTALTAGGGGGGGGSYSTPATQRIIAGLWHKLVRHCADSLPTSLESDGALLGDILAGRVSGFAAGPTLSLDPASSVSAAAPPPPPPPPAAARTPAPGKAASAAEAARARNAAGAASGRPTAVAPAAAGAVASAKQASAPSGAGDGQVGSGGEMEASNSRQSDSAGSGDNSGSSSGSSSSASAEAAVVAGGAAAGLSSAAPPTHGSQAARQVAGAGTQQGPGGRKEAAAAAAEGLSSPARAATAPGAVATASASGICRTGRRAGRLYAAVRARVEHKELLAVAEELLLQYARN